MTHQLNSRRQVAFMVMAVLALMVTAWIWLALHGTATAAAATTPSTPTSLRGRALTATSVTVSWHSAADATRYAIIVDGHERETTDARSVRITSLKPASTHDINVQAIDASGHRSSRSVFLPVTTRAGTSCTLYAASSGGTNSGDGSRVHPVSTATRLVELAGAGDVACLSGSFVEDLTIRHGGTRDAPLTLRSTPGLSRATIRGRMWVTDNANNVVIAGLNIDGTNLDGGELPSPTIEGDRVRLLDNDITNHRHHICVILGSIHGFGAARSAVLDGNRIHDCGRRPGNNHHHGVYLENAIGTRITNNVIADSADRGIQLYPSSQNALIARNVLFRNGEGVIFSGNEGYASNGNRVVDNVITWARTRYNIEYWWPEGNPVGQRNLAARNCVWHGAWGNIAEVEPGLPRGFETRSNLTADPLFRAPTSGDYRPRSGSPCSGQFSGLAPLTRLT
ncbi:MAG: right-handed parallel beta-helix repeat-containing protein [Thermoleophilia bacterium]|nr:right-handed parallel beta-helix repeat-containing protein [Thermoleophilia bacterium]